MSAGVRSAATSTPASSIRGWGGGTPSRRASTWVPTLRRSSARARRYSSSRPSQAAAVRSIASRQARAAERPSAWIARRAGARRASSRRNSRCASKIPASVSPARAATASRWRRTASTVSAIAASSAAASASGSEASSRSISSDGTRQRRTGPIAMPGEAANPRTTPSAGGAAPGAASGAGTSGAPDASIASSKSRAASALIAAIASAACGPPAATSISWPAAAPSVATAFRLAASAGPRPLVRFRTSIFASNPEAVCTNRAAGRACRPCGFRIVSRSVTAPSPTPSGAAASSTGVPRCAIFPARPPRASVATASSVPPIFAVTAAATAPSTSGASHRSTRAR